MSGQGEVTLNPGANGAEIGVDVDPNGVSWETTKIGLGDAGNTPVPVSANNPLPVSDQALVLLTQILAEIRAIRMMTAADSTNQVDPTQADALDTVN